MWTTISIILGFTIGVRLMKYLVPNTEEHGPDSNIIRKEIYQDQNMNCYHYEPVAHLCGVAQRRRI